MLSDLAGSGDKGVTVPGEKCPQCSARRIGAFRFCLHCGFDYDMGSVAPRAAAGPAARASGAAAPVARDAAEPEAPVPLPSGSLARSTAPEPAAPVAVWPAPSAPQERAGAPTAEPELLVVSERPRPGGRPAIPSLVAGRNDRFLAGAVVVILGLAAVVGLLRGPMPQLNRSNGHIASGGIAAASAAAPAPAIGSPSAIAQASAGQTLPATGSGAANSEPPGLTGPSGPTEHGVVVRVIDGDTVEVMVDRSVSVVRYLSIDVPGSAPNTLTVVALDANRALVERQTVILERDVSNTDPDGRLLRHVWRQDTSGRYTLISAELVREGLALVATSLPDVKYADELGEAQAAAKADAIGLWAP